MKSDSNFMIFSPDPASIDAPIVIALRPHIYTVRTTWWTPILNDDTHPYIWTLVILQTYMILMMCIKPGNR